MATLQASSATPDLFIDPIDAALLQKIDEMLSHIRHLSIVQASEVSDNLLDMRQLITSRN